MNTPPEPLPAAPHLSPAKRRHIPGLLGWLVGIVVLGMLASVFLPVFGLTCERGAATKSLASAKAIGMSLLLFEKDHDGNFPRAGLPDMPGAEPRDSNMAFAVLFPTYCTSEKIFSVPSSAYQTRVPDEKYDEYTGKPNRTLEPGENAYAYVMGLTEKSDPSLPLLADGTDGTAHYVADRTKHGGVWQGKHAIVIRADASGEFAPLAGPDDARYVRRPDDGGNLLDVSRLAPAVRLLDPAVDPAPRRSP